MTKKEEQKEILKLDVAKTLGSHVLELNEALNLKSIIKPTSEAEKQKKAIKTAVVKYQKLRNDCLNQDNVMKILGISKETFEKGSIAEDLEMRAKDRTLSKLKRQGE